MTEFWLKARRNVRTGPFKHPLSDINILDNVLAPGARVKRAGCVASLRETKVNVNRSDSDVL